MSLFYGLSLAPWPWHLCYHFRVQALWKFFWVEFSRLSCTYNVIVCRILHNLVPCFSSVLFSETGEVQQYISAALWINKVCCTSPGCQQYWEKQNQRLSKIQNIHHDWSQWSVVGGKAINIFNMNHYQPRKVVYFWGCKRTFLHFVGWLRVHKC